MRAFLVLALACLVTTSPVAANAVSTMQIAHEAVPSGTCCCPTSDDGCPVPAAPACGCGCRASTPAPAPPADSPPPPAPLDVRATLAASFAAQPLVDLASSDDPGIAARSRAIARAASESAPLVCVSVCSWLI
jgi:hypothetical protein